MANPAKITGVVTITAIGIGGSSVACTFSSVLEMKFDYFMGKLMIHDSVQGVHYFGLTEVTALTYTVLGTVTTIVIT